MGQDAVVKDKDPRNHNSAQSVPSRPPSKKKSLARFFTTTRSPSRPQAPSRKDTAELPTTPTTLGQYFSTPRKASTNGFPFTSSDGHGKTLQSVTADVINTPVTTNEQPSTPTSSLRGILKPQGRASKLHGNLSEQENQTSPGTPPSGRSRATKASSKRSRDKNSTYNSPTFSKFGKATVSGITVESPTSFPLRNRGASTASLTLSRLRASPIKASIPSRPSTSGGEQRRRGNADVGTADDDYPGLGLSLSPLSAPTTSDDTEVRASLRSAITSCSSVVGASTARSSVVTKDTSVSDGTVDSPPRDAEDEGMTVDEAIGMYEKGFADDIDPDHESPDASISEQERRRSMKIAEAISDPIGSESSHAMQAPTAVALKEATTPSKDSLKGNPQTLPQIMPLTTTCDQYGFLKASRYITVTQYDMWNKVYASEQLRRTAKWYTYMSEQGCSTTSPTQFPDRGSKTLRYVRKGIPPAWRGAAWFYYCGGAEMLEKNPETYPSLVSKTSQLSSNDAESIERDLHRTFPDNINFKPEQPSKRGVETPLLSSLRCVLRAFAIYRPQIGYCQSLNFLAGLLLLFLPEEKTFWMLHIITTEYLPGTHEISLEGANVDLWVLMLALKESSPSIWAKVGVGDEEVSSIHTVRLPPISLCTTSWFMSMFIGTLPTESVLRVWDVVFYEGSKMLFRIALAIFKMGEPRIKAVNDSMELFQIVQSFPRGILDIGALMRLACRRGGISQEWINKKRKDRRKWYATEKAKVAGPVAPMDTGDGPSTKNKPNLSRANSAWKRRVGLV